MDIEEQYDKIYRYCYFKLKHQQEAEDVTQEAFLRYLKSDVDIRDRQGLPYLYTIAHNLCVDKFREIHLDVLTEDMIDPDPFENIDTKLSIKNALSKLPQEDQELLLLRYINEVPISVMCKIMGLSRFSIYRKTSKILKQLKKELREEGLG